MTSFFIFLLHLLFQEISLGNLQEYIKPNITDNRNADFKKLCFKHILLLSI